MLNQQRLKELLSYDPETGVFTWLARTAHRIKIGDFAGSFGDKGYVLINVDGIRYPAHRLAWLYTKGVWPTAQIDHIDGNRANNKIANLRDVTNSVNGQNKKQAMSHNKLGVLGVSAYRGKFVAKIKVGAKLMHLGTFNTPELAYAAYVSAKRQHHPGCTI